MPLMYSQNYIPFLMLILLSFMASMCLEQAKQEQPIDSVAYYIKNELMLAENKPSFRLFEERLYSLDETFQFYEGRQFRKIWNTKDGFSTNTKQLINELNAASLEGLNPGDYHTKSIQDLVRDQNPSAVLEGSLDILLTDAYLTYAKHLYNGKVCPDQIDQEWYIPCRKVTSSYQSILNTALRQNDIPGSLDKLRPSYPGYHLLKSALARYRRLEKQSFTGNQTNALLVNGHINRSEIRRKLKLLGDLKPNENRPHHLTEAIVRFKIRHGLVANDEIDSVTIAMLNEPSSNRISTIIANLERWRWLPEDLGSKYIKVNMADFKLELINEGRSEFSSAVIIGTPFHSTPAFSADLVSVILNPYWNVPKSIVSNEILLKEDPISYMKTHQIEVLNSRNEAIELDSVAWDFEKTDEFPYTLRQKPGPSNALGLIKFDMPNSYSVYIHDTPERELFKEQYRVFSHGCIRLQEPFKLAALLLQGQSEWDLDAIRTIVVETQLPKTIDLIVAVPVHVFYWTAWIDQWQRVNFRKDVYLRDQTLLAALQSSPQ